MIDQSFYLIIEIVKYVFFSLFGVEVVEDFLFINLYGDGIFYLFILVNQFIE